MNFYLSKNGQKLGPYSIEQIQLFIRQGLAVTTDQVWAEGWPAWKPIANVPELAPIEVSSERAQVRTVNPQLSENEYAEGKNPTVACVLSLVIVGTGQFYNGDWGKGWFLLITCIIFSAFSFGTLWFFWALMSAIDACMVAAKKRPLRGSFFKF